MWFRGDELHVVMRDQDARPNEDCSFLVDFVVVPPTPGLTVSHTIDQGTATGGGRVHRPVPRRAHILLTGWAFNFRNGDHEIRDIGVDRQGDDFVPCYADKNADDPFDWRLEWARLEPQVIAPPRVVAAATQ